MRFTHFFFHRTSCIPSQLWDHISFWFTVVRTHNLSWWPLPPISQATSPWFQLRLWSSPSPSAPAYPPATYDPQLSSSLPLGIIPVALSLPVSFWSIFGCLFCCCLAYQWFYLGLSWRLLRFISMCLSLLLWH